MWEIKPSRINSTFWRETCNHYLPTSLTSTPSKLMVILPLICFLLTRSPFFFSFFFLSLPTSCIHLGVFSIHHLLLWTKSEWVSLVYPFWVIWNIDIDIWVSLSELPLYPLQRNKPFQGQLIPSSKSQVKSDIAKIVCLRSVTTHGKPLFSIDSKQCVPYPNVFFSRRQKVGHMNPLWRFLFSYGNRTLVQGKEWIQRKGFFVVLEIVPRVNRSGPGIRSV